MTTATRDYVNFEGLGCLFLQAGPGISFVEHDIAPRTLAAPMHVHRHEDEYSYVLEGEVGIQVGDEIRHAGPGELVSKPRGIWHAFWNRTDRPARLLEVIVPGGFEGYFREIAPVLPPNRDQPDFDALGAAMARYGLDMDFESIPVITEREGLASGA